MKNMKKILALLVAVMILAVSMSVAFADDPTGSITLKSSPTVDVKTRNFKAYKILDATYNGDAIAYTVPAALHDFYNDYAAFAVESKDVATQAAAANKSFDQLVAEKIAGLTTAATLRAFLDAALAAAKTAGITGVDGAVVGSDYKFSGLPAGYYAIEDVTADASDDAAKAKSAVMLDTVKDGNIDITIKANVPSPEKKILTVDELYNEKANEAGIGRTVNYVVTEKVPNYNGYTHYYYILEDTLHKGLTFNDDIVVKVGTSTLLKDTDYFVYKETKTNGDTYFEIAFNNIKSYAIGAAIEVTYSAQVNKDAVTGINPNTNKIEVEYSNNPNKSERPETETNPGKPNNRTDHPLGKGPADWTNTYTTKITIFKKDATTGEKVALPGVEFTLTGTAKSVVAKAKEAYIPADDGTYYMLQNGKYTTTAPRTEATVEVTTGNSGWVVAEEGYTGDDTRTVGNTVYRPYKEADGDATHYTIVEENTGDYKSTTIKYKPVVVNANNDAVQNYDVKMVGITDSNGELVFEKLGAGNFTLTETGVLPGFNGINPITFTLECQVPKAEDVKAGTETAKWSYKNVKNGTIEFDEPNGTFKITIDNKKGVELPETGGMGTTLLYVGGSILVILAAVLLITKRRMSSEE